MSRLAITAAFTIIAVAVAVCSFLSVRAQQGTIDLNGRWKTSDGQEVVIAQSGQTVKATFVSGGDCPSGGTRDFYLQGSLSGNSLSGTMKRCTRNQQLLQDCHLTDPYTAKIIDATVDQNTITGKYVPDYITYDEKNGHYVNCQVQPGQGAQTAFSLTRGAPAAASKPTTEARAEVKTTAADTKVPPILTIAIASAIDEKGKLVNPRFTFPPNEPQITAIIYVGKTGQLKVTWYKVSEDEDGKPFDEKLFEHQIQVKSDERAFSVAKNPSGTLELGRYKVVATLEGQTKETKFDISPPKRPSRTPNRPDEELSEEEPRSVSTGRAFSLRTNSGGLRGARAYKWATDALTKVQTVEWNTASLTERSNAIAPQGTQRGHRPVAGTSGSAPQSTSAPAASGVADCVVKIIDMEGRDSGSWDRAFTVDGWALARCTKSYVDRLGASPLFDVSATVSGPPQQLDWFRAGTDQENRMFLLVDPCKLPGPSDVPGTRVTLRATSASAMNYQPANSVYTLGEDTSAPRVYVSPIPARGSLVKAGDKIDLVVVALEEMDGPSWQTGVRRIWLEAKPEGSFDKDEWNNPSRLPKPCEQKTWKQDFQATYTVPKNPPPIIEICSYAYDYGEGEGNEGYDCAYFATGEWRGTLTEFERGYRHNSTAKVIFSFNEERDGTIKGAGRFKLISDSAPWNNCTLTRKLITPEPLLFPISGRRVGDEFHLELPTDYRLRLLVNTDCPPPQTSGTGTETRSLSLGQSGFFFRPKVKAQDGATNTFQTTTGGMEINASIEIHRAKQ